MRLLDSFRQANYLPENVNLWHEWVQQTYGKPEAEVLRPEYLSYAQNGYSGNSIIFSVILARASLFSEATFKYRNLATRKLYGSPSLGLLENPWPNGTTGELLWRMEQDGSIAGNAFIRNDGDRLVRLRPDWVEIVRIGAGEDTERFRWDVAGYLYWPNGPGGDSEFYPVEEVAHWSPIPDPLASFRGMSWLTPVVREVNTDLALTDFKRQYLDNSATPNLLIKYKQQLTDKARGQVRDAWAARYSGANGLKTAILDNGADATVIGDGLQSMDITTVQAAGETRIAAAAGVPGIVVGLKEGLQAATYSNYGQAMRRFADITMRPLWRSACACLASITPVPGDSQLWYDTSDIAALRDSENDRAVTMQTQALAAINFINAGYEPDSVTAAIVADDLSMLKHTGAIPTALYPGGKTPDAPPQKITPTTGRAPHDNGA